MRVKQFIILAAIFGLCLSSAHVVGSDSDLEMAQTPADSIIAPNAFSPNGDGVNDFFEMKSKEGNPVLLRIYSRNGTLVFNTEAKVCRWDGRSLDGQELPIGVYSYIAEVNEVSPKITRKGTVTIIR